MYRALFSSPKREWREIAVAAFFQSRDFYHPICAKMIALDLQTLQDSSGGNKDHLGLKEIKKRSLQTLAKSKALSKTKPVSVPKMVSIGALVAALAAVGIMTLRRSRR